MSKTCYVSLKAPSTLMSPLTQVSQLELLLAEERQQRALLIQRCSRNSQSTRTLREQLSDSLQAVTLQPIAAVLASEALRLDQSLREEELRASLGQSGAGRPSSDSMAQRILFE